MSALSKQVIGEFCKLCSWAHESWATHRTMFDDNPHLESIRYIGRNAAFLDRISIITQEYALLQIMKLHDPAVIGNRVNLTLDYIVLYGGWDEPTLSALEDLKKKLDSLAVKIRPARNKVLCHNDLQCLITNTSQGAIGKDADIDYFRTLEEFVNIVSAKTAGGSYEFGDFAENDAQLFMETLTRR